MKLALALAVLGVTTSGAFASTTVPATHSSAFVPTLAAVGYPVPEPATLGVLGIGAASLILRRRRRNNMK